jgi:hypothetical protein
MGTSTYAQQMKAHYRLRFKKMIRLGATLSLIFFGLLPDFSCSESHGDQISLVWENNKAKAVAVPRDLLKEDELDSIRQDLVVQLKDQPNGILGDYTSLSDRIVFTPAFPFTAGKEYEIFYKRKLLKQISIPFPDSAEAPHLLNVYPSVDTLPENVLKLYLHFSAPMREGEALKHISLLNNKGDTLEGTFLDLQPELWNAERDVLTVWFDPGRIKRELIPNLALGNPLKSGEVYTLLITSDWKDTRGLHLKEDYRRSFFVAMRDSIAPDPNNWKINLPLGGTMDPLRIEFPEPLDYYLLKEVITIMDMNGKVVPGVFSVAPRQRGINYHPQAKWLEGEYKVRVETHLEDLAGNNINRPFEQDIVKSNSNKTDRFLEIRFRVAEHNRDTGNR